MYDPAPAQNDGQMRATAALLHAAGLSRYDANWLALFGGLSATDGAALRQTAQGSFSVAVLLQAALPTGGTPISGSILTVEEVYARMAALGYEGSPEPVAFHCLEDGCHARAHLMVEQMPQLGLQADRIRKLWAFSERAF